MNYFKIIKSYLSYRNKAVNAFGIQAPFLFNLLQDVIYQKSRKDDFIEIESLRKALLTNNSTIEVRDFGAGSRVDRSSTRTLASIARHSLKPPKTIHLIHRLIKHFEPANILEIGTSFGISTLYMANANPKAKIVTLEGCPMTADIARKNFKKLKAQNIHQLEGNFDTLLPLFLAQIDKLDFVFFDGNHRKIPTLAYFDACLKKAHNDTVFIFDDIHWSEEMEDAWEDIQKHSKTVLCLDFYDLGIVFFKEGLSKENFSIKF